MKNIPNAFSLIAFNAAFVKKLVFLLSLICLPLFSFSQTVDDNDPRTQFVGLANGQKVYARRVQVKSPFLKSNYFLLDDSIRFETSAVKYYQNENGFFLKISDPYGGSDDFAQRVLNGRISKYYISKTFYNNYSPYGPYGYGRYGGFGGYGMGGSNRRNIYFFSKDNGELQSYNYNNLYEAIRDNPGSVELLNQYRKSKYLETGVSLAGAGLLIYGFTQSFRNSSNNAGFQVNPTVYAGAALISIPWLTGIFKKDKLTQAVELYNYNQK